MPFDGIPCNIQYKVTVKTVHAYGKCRAVHDIGLGGHFRNAMHCMTCDRKRLSDWYADSTGTDRRQSDGILPGPAV